MDVFIGAGKPSLYIVGKTIFFLDFLLKTTNVNMLEGN